jgi:hypothetical protein
MELKEEERKTLGRSQKRLKVFEWKHLMIKGFMGISLDGEVLLGCGGIQSVLG